MRFREVREIKNESEIIEKKEFERRLAELDKPIFEVDNEMQAKRALEEKFKELNKRMVHEYFN